MTVRLLARGLSGAAALLVLAAGSRASWTPAAGDDGMLRLTLSARPERLETCRRVSDAELARRPIHMRQTVVCEGTSATYRLQLWRGEAPLEDVVLEGGGWRRDRPIHLLREYALPPGTHRIRVVVRRIETASAESPADTGQLIDSEDRERREATERRRRRMESLPPLVELDREFTIRRRGVTLVTWDPVARALKFISAMEDER
jgi:hypothetical protein